MISTMGHIETGTDREILNKGIILYCELTQRPNLYSLFWKILEFALMYFLRTLFRTLLYICFLVILELPNQQREDLVAPSVVSVNVSVPKRYWHRRSPEEIFGIWETSECLH